jgi:hypothetical protein
MNIGARYKLIGKRRRALLDLPYDEVIDTFENALSGNEDSRLSGSVNRDTGVFKIEYKIADRKNDTYENYCMLVELKPTEGGTKIEYAFVYDRLISWYTRILSVICFLVPLAAILTIFLKFELKELVHLAIYIPLGLISAFGVFSLFGYKESKSKVKPMVKEFEAFLMSAFSD